ncbi:hypothetical protein J7E43_05430 [Bacillus sp. ISL-8]|nr:hypothetical protein [Bacillus sp. ISL-8]
MTINANYLRTICELFTDTFWFLTCYICIVRSGGKHNSLCCFKNSKWLHIGGMIKNPKPADGND